MQEYIQFFQANPVLSLAWVGLFVAVIVTSVKAAVSKVTNVNHQELTQMVNKQSAVVVDVRGREDYKKGHIVDALNVPLSEIKNNQVANLEKHKSSPIIVVCDAGMTSSQAAQLLIKQGFENVSNLTGGMSGWKTANLPVIKSKR
ncbi:rhodanese-like domain-containing protein [Shewanella intestini]|uniref:Rhodanese-like domain-containing protein n=1 Tax=Shewanella intestini TaxID=2017544 RepID=A0ABS5I3H6_9GAMM|nr:MULTISPECIES: rhodanese-like domain-containing protein [Shewanella]MBR9728580.1 rhodanese-like domain-containing protein [Shewanella intestini]MRG37363.1 rhodanese-like domain-containing protein [Shewanella sp. XMDDZSB0408]